MAPTAADFSAKASGVMASRCKSVSKPRTPSVKPRVSATPAKCGRSPTSANSATSSSANSRRCTAVSGRADRVVAADDLAQNVLKGTEPRSARCGRIFGQSGAQGGGGAQGRGQPEDAFGGVGQTRTEALDHSLRLAGPGGAAKNVYRRGHIRGPWCSARMTGPMTHYSAPRPPTQRTMQRRCNRRPSIAALDRHTYGEPPTRRPRAEAVGIMADTGRPARRPSGSER